MESNESIHIKTIKWKQKTLKSLNLIKIKVKTSFIKSTKCLCKIIYSCMCIKNKKQKQKIKKNKKYLKKEITSIDCLNNNNKVINKNMINDNDAIEVKITHDKNINNEYETETETPNETETETEVEIEIEDDTKENDNVNDNDDDDDDDNQSSFLLYVLDENICFKNDYDIVKNGHDKYVDFFSPLLELKEGDKINIYNNTIYISNNSWLQSMERWYYSQSRQYSLNILEKTFDEYIMFISTLIQAVKKETSLESIYKSIFSEITSNNIKLSVSLIELSKTYQNDITIVKRYNEIRNKLIFENTNIISNFY